MGVLESNCASCHHLSENEDYKYFYCYIKSKDVKATDTKCYKYLEEYYRSDQKRISMYEASGGKYKPDCYITTALCYILGYQDDCYYLQVLRNFRDNILKQNAKYLPLLLTYDVIGPQIAQALLRDKDNIAIATTIFNNYITKSVTAIEHEKYEEATNIYVAMTHILANKYNINTHVHIVNPNEIDIKTLGHGKRRKLTYEKPKVEIIEA